MACSGSTRHGPPALASLTLLELGKQVLQAHGQGCERMQRHLRVLHKRYNLTLYLGDEGAHRIGRRALGRGREHRVFPVESSPRYFM
jgi:hypothetical protein